MDVATPGELVPAIESVAKTVGLIMNTMLEDKNNPSSSDNSNSSSGSDIDISEDPCSAVTLIDQINADKPGVVEYETDIGDDGKILIWLDS